MLEQISLYLISIILGIMFFFSFVIAPVTFSTLNEKNARLFIRKIFPYYYNFNFIISLIVLIIFILLNIYSIDFYLILLVSLLFLIANYLLMPLINTYRDKKLDDKFKLSHFLSVIINFFQMGILIFLLV